MREDLPRLRLRGEPGGGGLLQFPGGRESRPAHRLVRAHDDPSHPGGVVQGLEGHDHLRRRAVGTGDDAPMGGDGLGIDLGDDERHVGVHAEEGALVDDHRAALDGPGHELRGDLVGRAADGDVDADERVGPQHLHVETDAGHLERATGGPLGSQQPDAARGKLPCEQEFDDDPSHGAGGADDGERVDHG